MKMKIICVQQNEMKKKSITTFNFFQWVKIYSLPVMYTGLSIAVQIIVETFLDTKFTDGEADEMSVTFYTHSQ